MSGIMSAVKNIFTPVQQVQVAPQPNQPLAIQNNSTSPADINAVANTPAQPEANQNLPLDTFKDLWQTPSTENTPADPWATPVVNMDANAVAERVKSMDFTQGIDPALAQQALQGDPNALMKLINGATQKSFEMSLQLASATTNAAADTIGKRVRDYVPTAYREQQIKEAPVDNPALEHPAFAPMVQATRAQIARQNPGISTAEVNKRANEYFAKAFEAYGSGTPASQNQAQAPAVPASHDFENW